jgi:type I restriction enzyme S subunit
MKWPLIRFEEVALPVKGAIVSGPFGSNIGSRFFVDEGVPIIRGNNLTFGQRRFIDDGFVYLTEEKAQEFKNCQAIEGDLVFTAAGTIGQVGIIPSNTRFERYIISNKQLRVRCDRRKANPLFLFLWFTTPQMRQHIINKNSGSTIPLINLGILRGLPVALPPLDVQDKIVATITSYDDLIENNRRRMVLLENSARLLYSEWFVRLRFPGYEHTSIVDGVPQGWEKKTMGETITLNYGKALKAEIRIEGEYPVYGSSGIVGTHEKPLVTGPAIILGRKGNVGSVYWSSKSFYPIDTVYFVNAESSSLYLFYALKHMHFISTDVAVPGLNREFAYSRALLHPPTTLLRTFHETVEAIHAQLDKLNESNQKLCAARDLLLPRLMSGELAA